LLIGVAGCIAAHAEDCKFSADRSGKIPVAGAKRVEIRAGAGDLRVTGHEGASDISATGKACASTQELLDQVQLEVTRAGDVIHVDVQMPDMSGIRIGNAYATLDVVVDLPDNVPLFAVDSSGDASFQHVATADISDSSGDLTIDDVTGDLKVRDSSGDLEIERVTGNLQLEDSSGDIEVDDIRGDVTVYADSSGSMTIEHIGKGVHVIQDSSGDIDIVDVKNDVVIDSDSSGEVDVRKVGGNFTLSHKGSGDIKTADIAGTISLPPGR
jgi:DUF4097 and DUF4098 domain-containing protein YvlB